MITIFKNINETNNPYYISVDAAIDRIRTGKSVLLVDKIRDTEDKDERNELKKGLPSVCFGGKFSSRSDNSLVQASGIMSIDFDGFKTNDQLIGKRFELEMDDYTHACFTSPSGNGIKVLVKIPKTDAKGYKAYFKAIQEYYNCEHFDKACSNISRVTYESTDENIFVNKDSKVWTDMVEEKKPSTKKVTIPLNDQNKTIEFLHKWWNKDYGLVSGSRNHNLFVLAAAYNQYGISLDDAISSMCKLEQPDFPCSEITTTIKSAYRNTAEFNTKKFEDKEKADIVAQMVAKSVPTIDIKQVIPEATDEMIEDMKNDIVESEFWIKSKKDMKVSFTNHRYRDFLVDNGFVKYYPSRESSFMLVSVEDNIITEVLDDNIRDFVFEYLYAMEDKTIYDAYAEKTKLGQKDFLGFLPNIRPKFLHDGMDYAYIYFRNCAVKVTADSVEQVSYEDLDGYVWGRQRLDRDFIEVEYEGCEYNRFVSNISGGDYERLRTMESTIGYLMHNFNDRSFNPVVILNDETISDKPEGGTGKGIFVSAISKLRNTITIDGKKFDPRDKFQYQRVTPDTQLLAYQDIEKNFRFDLLFSQITDGMTIEMKNKMQLYFPFEEIPKMVITTNHAVKGDGNSYERRQWELEFTQYYKNGFTPLQEFGHNLFDGWDTEEWHKFDNYMIANLQMFLSKGLIKSKFKNLKVRKLEAATSSEFREWCLGRDRLYNLDPNVDYTGQDLFNDFVSNYPDYAPTGKARIANRTFYKWLDEYAKFRYNTKLFETKGFNGKIVRFIEEEKQTKLCI